jgi:hypothetical protein
VRERVEMLGLLRAAFIIAAIVVLIYLLRDPSLQAYMRAWFH